MKTDLMDSVIAAEVNALMRLRVTPAWDQAVDTIYELGGVVVTTGIGKAGLVARKFAASLCSIGRAAAYLHPGDAQHGDLGITGEASVLVAFTNSGKTREVLETVKQALRLKPVVVIAITGNPAAMAPLCDIVLDIGEHEEADPLGLMPTCSTVAMLACADAIAVAVAARHKLTAADFGRRHHGGYLGEQCNGAR